MLDHFKDYLAFNLLSSCKKKLFIAFLMHFFNLLMYNISVRNLTYRNIKIYLTMLNLIAKRKI